MKYADEADDLVLLANSSAQTKFLLHSMLQAEVVIGLNMNADKTEYVF